VYYENHTQRKLTQEKKWKTKNENKKQKSGSSCFLEQELISYHCCSGCCSCWCSLFKKARGSIVSNQIGMKFGMVVLQVHTRWLTESDFGFDVTLWTWWPWRDFIQKSAVT